MRSWLTVLVLFARLPVFSQDVGMRPTFDVAAIKECVGTVPRGAALNASPGRLSIPCFPLLRLIQDAYQIFGDGTANFMYQPPASAPIEGFPAEMSSARYSIDAKAESPRSVGMMRGPMMQRLLEDRFHLKIRREIRNLPIYIMTVAKDGPKLQATNDDSCSHDAQDYTQALPSMAGGKPICGVLIPPTRNGAHYVLDERGITVDAFAKFLKIGGLPIINRTGLAGTFDIRLEWEFTPPEPIAADSGAASDPADTAIIGAIRKQLGLQLTSGKGPWEILVIDRLEKPSEN